MTRILRPLLVLLYLAWLAGWFWAFSFGFSDSFFDYHRATRIPVLLLGLFAVAFPPLSCYATLRRAIKGELGRVRASVSNAVASAAPLAFFWVVLAVWVALGRWFGHTAFEADEAMGNGIVFLLCAAVVLVAVLLVPLVLGGVAGWRLHR